MWKNRATKVLIIEDRIQSVITLRNLLRGGDFDVFSSCSEQALKLSMQEEPDIILLDFNLENGNGFEILRKLKSNERTLHIPVIVLSKSDSQENWDSSYKLGAVAYLLKPDHYPLLLDRIDQILYQEEALALCYAVQQDDRKREKVSLADTLS